MVTWDPAAWLEFKKGCVGHAGAHRSRLLIWENDLQVYREGGYTTESGKDVPLGGDALLDEPFRLSFISTGAIKKRDEADFGEEDVRITRERIRTVFRVGLDRGHDSLILGGWGCGAFKNPVGVMAGLFREVCDEPEFRNRYRAVWFACMERSTSKDPSKGKYAPFYKLFGKL